MNLTDSYILSTTASHTRITRLDPVFTLTARIDVIDGASSEPEQLLLRYRNVPASVYGSAVLGRPVFPVDDSLAWYLTHERDDIVLVREPLALATRGPLFVHLTLARPFSASAGERAVHVELSGTEPTPASAPIVASWALTYVD